MDPVTLTITGIVVPTAVGLVSLYYTRRQTRLAEVEHKDKNRQNGETKTIDLLEEIRKRKVARVGILHYPPFTVCLGEADEAPTGLYADLLRSFCISEGIAVEFMPIRFSSALAAVRDGQVDMVLSTFQTPRRSREVDFCTFMHSVSVSGVVRRTENRIKSQTDLMQHHLQFVVCKEEIGHEILEDHLRIPNSQIEIVDTSNVAKIFDLVASKAADIAIADSLSCQHGLAARGADGPQLKPVLRRHPLYLCPNGIMIPRNQSALAAWLERGIKPLLASDAFKEMDDSILEEYHGIITKL